MSSNGWKFDLTNDGSTPSAAAYAYVGKYCAAKNGKRNWFGWSDWKKVGTLSTVLKGSGNLTINFGNCWNSGKVKVYLDAKLMATADKSELGHPKTVTATFAFHQGSLLEIKDEGDNSVISLNSMTFDCSGKILFPLLSKVFCNLICKPVD